LPIRPLTNMTWSQPTHTMNMAVAKWCLMLVMMARFDIIPPPRGRTVLRRLCLHSSLYAKPSRSVCITIRSGDGQYLEGIERHPVVYPLVMYSFCMRNQVTWCTSEAARDNTAFVCETKSFDREGQYLEGIERHAVVHAGAVGVDRAVTRQLAVGPPVDPPVPSHQAVDAVPVIGGEPSQFTSAVNDSAL
jgi:hypothetical protein